VEPETGVPWNNNISEEGGEPEPTESRYAPQTKDPKPLMTTLTLTLVSETDSISSFKKEGGGAVGEKVGEQLEWIEGRRLGDRVGPREGMLLGLFDGKALDDPIGANDGGALGANDGGALGANDGGAFGANDGGELGANDGGA
jgi:hypothetical protein